MFTAAEFKKIKDALGAEVAAKIQGLFATDSFTTIYQKWMESLAGYDADADDQCVVRMSDGTFECKIVNHQ